MRNLLSIGLISLTFFGCGGAGDEKSGTLPVYSCAGSGSLYTCVLVNAGAVSEPEPVAQPFPIAKSLAVLVNNGLEASGLYSSPYAPGTFSVSKARGLSTFNGQAVTVVRTTTNWTAGGYPTPYDQFFDSSNTLYGFSVLGWYGLRTSLIGNPIQINEGETGTLANYNLYQDSLLTRQVGTATLTYSISNCCDLWSKKKATFALKLAAVDMSSRGLATLTQRFVVTTSGGISFASEEFNSGSPLQIYNPLGGY